MERREPLFNSVVLCNYLGYVGCNLQIFSDKETDFKKICTQIFFEITKLSSAAVARPLKTLEFGNQGFLAVK